MKNYEDINFMEIDALREVGSIGTSNAANALAELLGMKVRISLPEAQIMEFNEAVERMGGFEEVAAGVLVNLSGQLNGIMLSMFHLDAVNLILSHMIGKTVSDYTELTELENSALVEIGNILVSSFLNAIAELSNISVEVSVPALTIDMQGAILTVPMAAYGNQSNYLMTIGGTFYAEGKEVPCRLLLSTDVRSLNYLLSRLGVEHYE